MVAIVGAAVVVGREGGGAATATCTVVDGDGETIVSTGSVTAVGIAAAAGASVTRREASAEELVVDETAAATARTITAIRDPQEPH